MRVIVFGAGLAGLKAWIALAQLPTVETVAFIDNDPQKRGTNLCGIPVQGMETLAHVEYDALLIASLSANAIRTQVLGQGVPESRIHVVDPGQDLVLQLRSRGLQVGSRTPLKASNPWRIAIFGAGMAGLHAYEALAHRPQVEIAAFIDSNERRRRATFMGLPVLSPLELESLGVDVIVLASVAAAAMGRELLKLGVDAERIMTVELFEWLLQGRRGKEHVRMGSAGTAVLGQELGC